MGTSTWYTPGDFPERGLVAGNGRYTFRRGVTLFEERDGKPFRQDGVTIRDTMASKPGEPVKVWLTYEAIPAAIEALQAALAAKAPEADPAPVMTPAQVAAALSAFTPEQREQAAALLEA